jgi:cytosine/adenosine deaminase-related metal-dependent hydrolase
LWTCTSIFPQTDVIGSPAEGLLPWLENYTFPHESRFADPAYAGEVATVFLDELQRNGVTTALTFATSHPVSVDALHGAGACTRPAHDCRQGAAGPPLARRRARRHPEQA